DRRRWRGLWVNLELAVAFAPGCPYTHPNPPRFPERSMSITRPRFVCSEALTVWLAVAPLLCFSRPTHAPTLLLSDSPAAAPGHPTQDCWPTLPGVLGIDPLPAGSGDEEDWPLDPANDPAFESDDDGMDTGDGDLFAPASFALPSQIDFTPLDSSLLPA